MTTIAQLLKDIAKMKTERKETVLIVPMKPGQTQAQAIDAARAELRDLEDASSETPGIFGRWSDTVRIQPIEHVDKMFTFEVVPFPYFEMAREWQPELSSFHHEYSDIFSQKAVDRILTPNWGGEHIVARTQWGCIPHHVKPSKRRGWVRRFVRAMCWPHIVCGGCGLCSRCGISAVELGLRRTNTISPYMMGIAGGV